MNMSFDLPKTPYERKAFFESMMKMNQDLIMSMYANESEFMYAKPTKLEEWIMRYDRIMGFYPDVLTLCEEINVAPVGDIRVELYHHLKYLVEKA
jgi:hypothetical protein